MTGFLKANYHTHTTFCDGSASARRMVETAIEKGFDAIGFSSHSDIVKDIGTYKAEIRSLADISEGDLIVHSGHGIGRFIGIRKIEMDGITKDYISIQYAGTDKLYIPVTQLDMVSKYIGPRDDSGVKLNKLSSGEWQKTRSNVKRAVKDMAHELIALYAKREKSKGFAFYPDDEIQHDFEERFPYVETDDQLQSIAEIKADMERARPMERLL